MSQSQNDNFKLFAPKDLNAWSGKFEEGAHIPYTDTAEAVAAIPSAYRFEGLLVRVTTPGGWRYYEWRGGLADGNLAEQTAYLLEGQDSAYHRSRTNHTGTQLASTISDFTTAARASFSAGSNVSIVNGVISATGGGGGGSSFSISKQNGDGIKYQFDIPHGLNGTPTSYSVTSPSHQADLESYTVNSTNIVVTLAVAPAVGVENVVFSWTAAI